MAKKKKHSADRDLSAKSQKAHDLFPSDAREQQGLEEIYALLLKTSQVDFSQYRDTTVLRRLNRRMNLCNQDSYTDYSNFLKENPAETELLFCDLLLSYTQFFRDTYVFDTLKKDVFPGLVKDRSARKPIRVWVPGCSNGKEVYSIAICLYESMEENKLKIPVKVFGTDLVEKHIVKARSGIYSGKITEEVSQERLERFFDKTPEGLKVVKHIREMCVFATQDITQDPPFPNMDLISCRNVLIYFDTAYQDAAIPRFHFALSPDGFLLLGSSETMGRFPELFDTIDPRSNLYSKRLTTARPACHFPVTQRTPTWKGPVAAAPAPSGGGSGTSTESAQIDKILLNAYAPPGVLVDSNLFVRRFIGNTHPYLSPASGQASLKLSRMAGSTLMPDIYTAIQRVKKTKDKVRKKNVLFRNSGQETYLDVCVIPVEDRNVSEPGFLILFEKAEASLGDSPPLSKKKEKDRDEVERLKQELQQTKEHLQSIIEEKDVVNQDLWSANEEIMSTNEELQSVNEEMEASKEELESGNEELLALNEELQVKNLAIAESEEKHRLLLQNIHAGVVVHAPDTSVLMANNRACEILGLTVDQMMGKTAMDPAWCFFREDGSSMPLEEYPVNQVIAKQESVSFLSVGVNRPQTNDVVWVLVHAFREMEADGTLRQVVVTFVDITERKRAEQEVCENRAQLKSLASELVLAEERERSRIAVLLHDDVCQNLAYAKMKIQMVSGALADQAQIEDLAEASETLTRIMQDTRTLTFDLSPPILPEFGLEAAVSHWLTEQVEQKHGIATQFTDDGQAKPLSEDIQALLFRSVRELLVNVVKHSKAKRVEVSICREEDQILIRLEDDGIGFAPDKVVVGSGTGGFGLFSIRERLSHMRGSLEIDSSPGRGCRSILRAPLQQS